MMPPVNVYMQPLAAQHYVVVWISSLALALYWNTARHLIFPEVQLTREFEPCRCIFEFYASASGIRPFTANKWY